MTHDPATVISLSEQRWRQIVASLPDYLVMVDRDGNIVFTNRADHGLSVDEVVGMNAYSMTPPEYWPAMQAAFDRAMQTGQPASYETRYDSPLGGICILMSRSAHYGKTTGLTG